MLRTHGIYRFWEVTAVWGQKYLPHLWCMAQFYPEGQSVFLTSFWTKPSLTEKCNSPDWHSSVQSSSQSSHIHVPPGSCSLGCTGQGMRAGWSSSVLRCKERWKTSALHNETTPRRYIWAKGAAVIESPGLSLAGAQCFILQLFKLKALSPGFYLLGQSDHKRKIKSTRARRRCG